MPTFAGSPTEIVSQVFSAAWSEANSTSNAASSMFSQALNVGGTAPSMQGVDMAFSPNVVEPSVEIPFTAEAASTTRFNEFVDLVLAKLTGLFSGYMTQYFPNENDYLGKAQQWIADAITEGGTGIAPAVEDQIWQRDRARVLREVERASQETLATFAARGFPVPPGAAAYQVQQAQQQAQDKIAQASRDVAIKQAEIEIENVRFAVGKAIDLYKAAVGAASDYIKALSIAPQAGIQLVPSVTDSQSRLISAASEYYRARIAVEDLKLKARMPDAEFEQAARIKNGDWIMQMVENRVKAAVEAARSLSTQAAAALNGLHAQASIGASRQEGIAYNYGGDVSTDVSPVTLGG